MEDVTIYYYSGCETCQNALAILNENKVEPKIVHYMEGEPITVSQLSTLLKKLEMPARSLLRKKAQTYNEFNLDDTKLTNGEIINLMVEHPELISRPIVMSSKGIKLCRPADTVLSLL